MQAMVVANVCLAIIFASCTSGVIGFKSVAITPLKYRCSSQILMANNGDNLKNSIDFNAIRRIASASIISASLYAGPTLLVFNPVTSTVANAEFRAQQKRTYFRYIPKFIAGRDFYKTELKNAIEKEDWKVVEKMFEDFVSKKNAKTDEVYQIDSYVNTNFFRPMSIFSGTFAERGSSPKERSLMEQEQLFENVCLYYRRTS